uniref:Uncharacterized protein n=1 Tax=Arundo donax TaxID=35708 RepID=A0A0A9BMK4_ARUDO
MVQSAAGSPSPTSFIYSAEIIFIFQWKPLLRMELVMHILGRLML